MASDGMSVVLIATDKQIDARKIKNVVVVVIVVIVAISDNHL